MLFAPVRLGSTALSAEVLTADVKNCKHFGPCGVGEKALYLNGFLFDRHYYVALGDIRRVFKRVAMSKGGFTGNGVFGAIPYLVVEYGDGTQKQCTFKREDNVDDLLAYLAKVCPGPALERILRFPQISSCTIKTFPDSTSPIDSAVSPARSTKAPFGKFLFSALRQFCIEENSCSEIPEKSREERITEKNSFIKASFVENSTDTFALFYNRSPAR